MDEYFGFQTEEEARDFFIDCLAKGVYAEMKYGECVLVKIDVTKTLEAKNAKTEK